MTIIDTTQIRRQASRADVSKALLTLVCLVPYVAGWLAGASITAGSWLWAAAIVGWRTARPQQEQPNPPTPTRDYLA